MSPNYDYQGKVRKEIWLTKTAVKKLEAQAKREKRKLKQYMEMALEQKANQESVAIPNSE